MDGDVIARQASSRHRNFIVTGGSGFGHFIKSHQAEMPLSAQTLQREAAFYFTVQQEGQLGALSEVMPKLHSYDPQRGILVVEHVSNSENLASYHQRLEALPENAARDVGRALGGFHREGRRLCADPAWRPRFASFLSGEPPWALTLQRFAEGQIANLSPANAQAMGIVRRHTDFASHLEKLQKDWKAETLIHGDIKFENCLICFPRGQGERRLVRLVDWEMVGLGDALWDVGGILQAHLLWWLNSSLGAVGPAGRAALARPSVGAALRAFWESYSEASGRLEELGGERWGRAWQYAAARILQSVFEANYFQSNLGAPSVAALQASLNILEDPAIIDREFGCGAGDRWRAAD